MKPRKKAMTKKTTVKKAAKVPVKKTVKATAQPAVKKNAKKTAKKSVKKPTIRTPKTIVAAPPQDMDSYIYAQAKAKLLLEKGIDGYRAIDARRMPRAGLEDMGGGVECLLSGCRQMAAGAGRTEDEPLKGLGIEGPYLLMETFHFSQESYDSLRHIETATETGSLQRLVFRHVIIPERMVVLYNEATYPVGYWENLEKEAAKAEIKAKKKMKRKK